MKRIVFILTVCLMTAVNVHAQLQDGHYYRISLGDKSMFVENGSNLTGSSVLLWSETDVAAQQWKAEKKDEGIFMLSNVYSGYYLSANNGTVTVRPQASARRYGLIQLQAVSGQADTYQLVCNGQKLTVASQETGAKVTVADNPSANADWQLVDVTDNVLTGYCEQVRDNIMNGFIKKYYKRAGTGYVLGNGGWWGDAEMFETILDAFETTGEKIYQTYFQQLYTNFLRRNGTDWSGNEYNDDITWMVLACIRAYKFFGTNDYLTKAKNNYDKMYARALQKYGTLIWKQSQGNKLSTNSCINCPAVVAACYLGEMTGDKTYYDKALSLYAAQRKLLFEPSTGKVNDSGEWSEAGVGKVNNGWASTYNQGTMLGAALMLFEYTKDNTYKQDAERIHNWTYKNLCNSSHLLNACQTIAGDLCGFKGIYMRYCRRYAQELDHEDALQWMEFNAWHAYQNRNAEGVIWSAWLTKTADDLKRTEGTETKTCEPFSASTAVSVAFNAHVNRLFNKPAFEPISVKFFDDIRGLQLQSDAAEGTVTTASIANAHLGFRNVDFGSDKATAIGLRVNATSSRSRIVVYVDSIAESQLIARSELLEREWTDIALDLSQELTGKHTIFLAFEGTGVQIASFRFASMTNGIEATEVGTRDEQSSAVYDLQGRRVNATSNKGLYIRNGKKYLIK